MDTAETLKGIVLYCDGGARPNPGFSGFGIHGYTYTAQAGALKGLGLGDVYTTNRGYKKKADLRMFAPEEQKAYNEAFLAKKTVPVQVINYIDAYCSIGIESNNAAEVKAMLTALEYVASLSTKPDFVQIYSDSKYALGATLEWVHRWQKDNWRKKDGQHPANLDDFKRLKVAYDNVVAMLHGGLAIEYIEAHAGHTGNEAADTLATLARNRSSYVKIGPENQPELFWFVEDADTYWKTVSVKHPFLSLKKCYFNTSEESQQISDSFEGGRYYLGDHKDKDEMLGKKASPVGYAVVRLEKKEPLIEHLKTLQAHYTAHADSLFAMHLDKLYSEEVYRNFQRFGDACVAPPKSYRRDIKYFDDSILTNEFKPPMLASRAIDTLTELDRILDQFLADPTGLAGNLKVNNITSCFFETTLKPIKLKKGETQARHETIVKLKPELQVGLSHVVVQVIQPGHVSPATTEDAQKHPMVDITLSTTIDIPDRNTFKKLEDLNPEVYAVTWLTSDYAFRYATVIRCGKDSGIWAAGYSNYRLLPNNKV